MHESFLLDEDRTDPVTPEAREFLRFEELLQETLEACPENCPDKAEVVKALKQVGVKILPPVHAAQETVAKETRSSSPGNG